MVASGSGTVLLLHRFQLLWNTLKLKSGCFVSTLSVWYICIRFVVHLCLFSLILQHFVFVGTVLVIFAHFGVICDML